MEKKISILTVLLGTFFVADAQNNNDTINISTVGSSQDVFQEDIKIQFPADFFSVSSTLPTSEALISIPSDNDFGILSEDPIVTSPKKTRPTKKIRPAKQKRPKPRIIVIQDTGFTEFVAPIPLSGEAAAIAKTLNNRHLNWQGIDNKIRSHIAIRELYADFNYQPLWTQSGEVTQLAADVIKETLKAGNHALRPELYHSSATSTIRAGTRVAEPEKFDVILSDAFVTYKKHLTNGVVDPKTQHKTWNTKRQHIDFAAEYNKARNSGADKVFRIHDKAYLDLQRAYLAEIEKPAGKSYDKVPATRTLRSGSKGKAVKLLRARLELPMTSDTYDTSVKQAVLDYQKQNGLGADGIAGRRTLRHMNGATTNHIEKLAINMERHRWSRKPQSLYIWVNIPAYEMAVKQGNKTLFESNVIVGRPKRPTPIFKDKMEHVVLAPYWNVPSTIFKEDKLPKLQKNPHALGKNMQVIEKATGKVVAPEVVNWQNGGNGYRLRQLPGNSNALGRMKFLFPNRHAIYLHDTPNRRLFKKSRRAFSSGCIRVERANDFALFLLDDRGYDDVRLKKESHRSKEKWINLNDSKRYPVFLDYYTAWADDNGRIHYESDIYGYDKILIEYYKQSLNN